MRTNLSKKLLAALLSLAMVLSLVGIQPANANAAAKYSITKKASMKAGKTVTYKVTGVKKTQYIKVTKKSANVTVKFNGKKVSTSKKIAGTGKALSLKVTAKEVNKNYTNNMTVKVYNKKTNKVVKTLKVSTKVNTQYVEEEPSEEPTEAPSETPSEEPTATLPEITGAKALKVDTLEVAFTAAVDTTDVTLTVKKGTLDVPGTVTWNADNTVATIKTTAKMTNGTYVITAKSAKTEATASKNVEIVSQYVDQIVVLNTVALTDSTKQEAYAYYDVLDQYGESIRTSTSIEWSGSCVIKAKKSTGCLTLTRNDGNDHTYNDQIFITGVYTKTGKTVQATLTVGTEQALHSIEIAGFVKKGTSEIVKTLPAGFASGAYYMLFTVTDQNGNVYDQPVVVGTDVTFVSDNVLVVKELTASVNPVTVDGVEYQAVVVEPGIKVADGGEVTVTAIANKTGNKTAINVPVGEDAVIASFTLDAPADIISDGEEVEIPFVALDQNGNEIKNFRTLAKQETFNTLTFTASEGTLVLAEEDDGTASLTYYDNTTYTGWDNAITTDGLDRPVSLTAVVVGGGTSNEMVYICDKARPDAIAAVGLSSVYVEGDKDTVDLDSFLFVDQYGRLMNKYTTNDNGFFTAAENHDLHGVEFAGYEFGVMATYSGNQYLEETAGTYYAANGSNPVEFNTKDFEVLTVSGNAFGTNLTAQNPVASFDITASTKVLNAQSGESFKYEIVRVKDVLNKDWESISTAKNIGITVVDIKAVKNIAISDLQMFYVETSNTEEILNTTAVAAGLDKKATLAGSTGLKNSADYKQKVVVTGTYNGTAVTIPTDYYTVDGTKVTTNSAGVELKDNTIDDVYAVDNTGLTWGDLYSKTAANYASKIAEDTLTARVYELYRNENHDDNNDGDFLDAGDYAIGDKIDTDANIVANEKPYDTAAKKVKISDQKPVATSFSGLADEYVVNPTRTGIEQDVKTAGVGAKYEIVGKQNAIPGGFAALDQYGVKISTDAIYRVNGIVEFVDGYAENNFRAAGNDSKKVTITGAERGDVFKFTVIVDKLEKTVSVTVGADTKANISNSDNNYRDDLVENYLEPQRIAGLN